MTAVRHVRQEDPYGCGVACIAMLAGLTYAEARQAYSAQYGEDRAAVIREGRGMVNVEADAVLARLGFAVARRHRGVEDASHWPPQPWGSAHLATVLLPTGGHFVVVLADGSVLDPAADPTPRRWGDFGEVFDIAAVVPV